MPTLIVTLSDQAIAEVVNSLCWLHGYQSTLMDGTANPETRQQFARRMVVEYLKDRVRDYRQMEALRGVDPSLPDIT